MELWADHARVLARRRRGAVCAPLIYNKAGDLLEISQAAITIFPAGSTKGFEAEITQANSDDVASFKADMDIGLSPHLPPKGEFGHNSTESGGVKAASAGGDEILGKTKVNPGFFGGNVASWRGGRVAEGDGLLNRYTGSNSYPGFESRPLRYIAEQVCNRLRGVMKSQSRCPRGTPISRRR